MIEIIDLEQNIVIEWTTRNKERYMSLGYNYTCIGSILIIKAKDLPYNSNTRVLVLCDKCGENIHTPYRNYNRINNNNGIYMCKKCSASKATITRINRNKERMVKDFRKFCENIGCTSIATLDDYIGCEIGMPLICPKHGKQFLSINQLKVGCICPECGKINKSLFNRKSIDDVIKDVESKNNNKLLNPEEYVGASFKNLKVQCGSCGKVFITSLASIKSGSGHCYSCGHQISEGEEKIKSFLDRNNISYIKEKRFPDCKYKNTLPFDFYLPNDNCCIEFDGIQHYKDIRKSPKSNLKLIQARDRAKTDYCKNKDIKLIRIPYWEFKNIDTILTKELIDKCS